MDKEKKEKGEIWGDTLDRKGSKSGGADTATFLLLQWPTKEQQEHVYPITLSQIYWPKSSLRFNPSHPMNNIILASNFNDRYPSGLP